MSFQRVHASDAMRVTNCLGDWLLALSRLCLHSLARMGSQEGPCTFSGQRRCLSLGPANLVVSCHQCGTSAADRAIDSSELRLTTDREGRQGGQHRSHIVAAVSSYLIARAAASGSQGRIMSSLSPGRPRADVGLSAVWSDLSAVSATNQVRVFLWLEGLSVCTPRDLSKSAL